MNLPITNIELFKKMSDEEFNSFFEEEIFNVNKNITFEQFESNDYINGFYHYIHNSITAKEGILIKIEDEFNYENEYIVYNRVLK